MIRGEPPPDDVQYESDIGTRITSLEDTVANNKWVVDLIALLALNTATCSIFVGLLRRAYDIGLSPKLTGGIIASGIVAWLLFWPSGYAVQQGTEALLLKVRALLRIPYGIEDKNIFFRGAWRAIVFVIYVNATWGTAVLLSELVKNAGLPA